MATGAKKKTPDEHVVCGPNSFRCRNCGGEYVMSMPCSIDMWLAASKVFQKEHRGCKPSAAGEKRYTAERLEDWIKCWDTGTSSETLWSAATGLPVKRHGHPHDPADFGRCHRLIQKFPQVKQALPKVAKMVPAWVPLVEHWDELTALYDEELPAGTAPKLYARMKELLGEKGGISMSFGK